MKPRHFVLFLLSVLLLLLESCATTRYEGNVADYRKTIRKLQQKIAVNPQDAESNRDLGVVYFQTKQYPHAKEYLRKASALNSSDAKTMFYLGMTLEQETNKKGALAIYINYTDFSPLSRYRKLMEGRYQVITRELIQEQFRTLLAQEDSLGTRETPANSVAVFPFAYQGGDERFSALGLGLSEMMLIDLGQVSRLRLIERIRVEELIKELRFGTTQAVDPATAPRLGRLLSAGRIISGNYNVSGENTMRLDVATFDVGKAAQPGAVSESDALDNLFRMQKEVVFKVIKEMGITLTREEQEKIQRFATKNMQAFIAYSVGLEKEGNGDYEAAGVYFRHAADLDPNFAPAAKRAALSESLSLGGGTKEQALAAAQISDPPPAPDATDRGGNLMTDRLTKVQNALGTGFVPGQDARKPAQEAAVAGAATVDLPAPPKPPN